MSGSGTNIRRNAGQYIASFHSGFVAFWSKLFNIGPSQWPRVTECWLITFFFKVGSAVGWTVLTAAFVSRFGIAFLPMLFIVNAILIIGGTFFFEQLIMRIKREVLMIIMVLCAAICLFIASFLYDSSPIAFFTLIIFAESVFLAQFNVFIPILVGDRFTPLESQNTFPFIESGETIGGMIGASVVGIFASRIPTPIFLYIWIGILACVIFVFIITSYVRNKLPPLVFRVKDSENREKTVDQVKLVMQSIKKIPFLKGLVMIVLLQWVFLNVLDFQYTKSLEQAVTQKHEETIASIEPRLFQASVLTTAEGKRNTSSIIIEQHRSLTPSEQISLTQKLGTYKSLIYLAALIVQALLASRLITSLGIVGSMLLHPIIMLFSLIWMFFKFGFASSFVTRLNFEMTDVIHNNAYFTSHYAFPKSVRDQAAEFLEGMVRPMGTIVGMIFLLGFQMFLTGQQLSMWIHTVLFVVMFIILGITLRLKSHYTKVSKQQLFSDLPYPDKLNAIEVLAQRGHDNAAFILVQKLNQMKENISEESPVVRIKLLSALGHLQDYQALPEILDALMDSSTEIRLEAANALMNFHDIGEKFYTQAFSRYRMIETLKEVFRRESSSTVRSAIIKVFSLLRQSDIVPFLLNLLKDTDHKIRADAVHTLGMFHDPNAAYYILTSIGDVDPHVRAHTIAALWQFPKYRPMLEIELDKMASSPNVSDIKASIFALGEIGVKSKNTLFEFLKSENIDLRIEAAFALTKEGDSKGFHVLLSYYLNLPDDQFFSLRRFIQKLKPKIKRMVEQVITNEISLNLNGIIRDYNGRPIAEVDRNLLHKLRRLYLLLDQHEEIFLIESELKEVEEVLMAQK